MSIVYLMNHWQWKEMLDAQVLLDSYNSLDYRFHLGIEMVPFWACIVMQ